MRAVRPRMIVCGGSSCPRAIDFAKFRQIADEGGAYLLADVSHYAGLIAGGAYPSPMPFYDFVTLTTYKTLGTVLAASFWRGLATLRRSIPLYSPVPRARCTRSGW